MSSRSRSIALITVAEVMAMSLWFSTAASLPALRGEFDLSELHVALLGGTTAIGFVAGSLVSALLGLADRYDCQVLFSWAAILAAGINLLQLVVMPHQYLSIIILFLVGACLAGVYPVALKLMASWAGRHSGLLLAILVGGLTFGSATPHLINAIADLDWRITIISSSALALASALLVRLASPGDEVRPAARFERRYITLAWTDKGIRYANLGYFGHMWELYPMWTWIMGYLAASIAAAGATTDSVTIKIQVFAVIASGAVGCLVGGYVSRRIGSARFAIYAMAASGTCALLAAMAYGGPTWLVMLILILWGMSIVADSPHFSACVVDFAIPEARGTLLTLQVCLGFLLTTCITYLLPYLVEISGWRSACVFLAIGPYFGIWAMRKVSHLANPKTRSFEPHHPIDDSVKVR